MKSKLLKSFSPSCKKHLIFSFGILGIEYLIYYILNKYNLETLLIFINNNLKYVLLLNGIYLLIFFIYCLYLKTFNKFYIYTDKIISRTGILKNTTIVPISNLMIINSSQTIVQFLLGLITVTIEADGDTSSPEIIMKDISSSIYEKLIMNFEHR